MKVLIFTVSLGIALNAAPAGADEQAAIDGCIDTLRAEGGPDAAGGIVLDSEFSQAGTIVTLKDAGGSLWRCIGYSDGSVGELGVIDAMDDGEGALNGAGASRVRSEDDMGTVSGSQTVRFQAGRSSTSLDGVVRGRSFYDYRLDAEAGQTMNVELNVGETDGNGAVYFNILPPGSSGEAIFIGSRDGRNASVRLPQDGTYAVRVYLMGNDRDADRSAGYELDIAIR